MATPGRPGRIRDVVAKTLRKSLPLGVLATVNVLMFLPHYLGRMTFPWDFLAGYHANSFGWYKAGSMLSPPAWLPWSDMGFPSFLALQSGAWYLPLALLDALGAQYSIHLATAIQCAHVLLGGGGAYLLFRRMGFRAPLALVGALAYQSSAMFYAGQQFVDIVRAAALLPWLWLSFNPEFLRKHTAAPLLTSLLLWQFIVAAYPGNIVSAVYASVVVLVVALAGIEGRRNRAFYLLLIFGTVLAALLMAMVKWYPVLAQSSHLEYEVTRQITLGWRALLKIVFPYDVDFAMGTQGMRSLWLPFALLWGAAFAKLRTGAERLGLGLIALTTAMAMFIPAIPVIRDVVPGMRLSRFLVSDWRPIFQLGLLLLALSGWTRLFAGEYRQSVVLARGSAVAVAGMCAGYGLTLLGFPLVGLIPTLGMIVVMSLGAGWLGLLAATRPLWSMRGQAYITAALCLLLVGDAAYYHFAQARAWRVPWSPQMEVLAYGSRLEAFGNRDVSSVRRPGRFVLGTSPEDALRDSRNIAYNRCWYAGTYCVLGYNNLKLSAPHKKFAGSLVSIGGADLLAFSRRPQQLLFLHPGDPGRVEGLTGDNITSAAIGPALAGAQVEFIEYAPGRAVYRIQANAPALVVENEIWWSGWTVSYCAGNDCSEPVDTVQTPQGLRAWHVEKGMWHVVVQYEDSDSPVGHLLLVLGLLLAGLLPLIVRRFGRIVA